MFDFLKGLVPKRIRSAVRSRLNYRSIMLRAAEQHTSELDSLRNQVAELKDQVVAIKEGTDVRLTTLRAITGASLDRIPELREQLLTARATDAYRSTHSERKPLVSVRIATYNRGKLLFERAIPSVMRQTYTNFEIVVVGDGCTDDTAARFLALADPRVRFTNLPHQGIYPDDPEFRWMVAGTLPMNEAAQLARGQWIAPLDDDDEFEPDHIEVLLDAALAGQFEMVYGKQRVVPDPPAETFEIGVYPPGYGAFGFQAALYMSALRMFEYDLRAWTLAEVGDWTMCRRMLETGVRIGWVPKVVTTIYPTGPRH